MEGRCRHVHRRRRVGEVAGAEGATTPANHAVRLTVTETYGTPNAVGGSQQNIVNATSPVIRLHDSPKELGDMALRFLGDSANSSVSPSTCVREFSDGCHGKSDERTTSSSIGNTSSSLARRCGC